MSFECCEWGDFYVEDEEGRIIYPKLCDCICHVDEDYSYD